MILNILNNEWIICELDDSLPVLRHRWKKPPPVGEFKSNLLQMCEAYKSLKPSFESLAWLADTTLLGELDEETETWLAEVWQQRLFVDAGLKVHAVILGEDIFADYPMEKFKQEAEEKFKAFDVRLGVFSNIERAYSWISEQDALRNERVA